MVSNMTETKINELKNVLARQLKTYIEIIKKEYKDFIPKERLDFLNSINNLNDVIVIEDTGTISMFVHNDKIYFPTSAFKIINKMKLIPGFGINKKHKSFTSDNLVINDNTYTDYIKHIFLSGLSVEEFYLETLLHETMHFCGIGGANALREGIAELKTRELALKYNLTTSGCGYPKEIKFANELQTIFGKEIIEKVAFAKNDYEIAIILRNNIGQQAVDLYGTISSMMEKEFYNKYSKYDFPGITGPIKKVQKYKQIDYNKIYSILNDYKQKPVEIKNIRDSYITTKNEKLNIKYDLEKLRKEFLSKKEEYNNQSKRK